MGRIPRVDVGDMVYHVLNRTNFRLKLFVEEKHYRGFLDILAEAKKFVSMRILSYCLMPNHWHLILYPERDGDLSRFMQRVTLTHTQRYHVKTKTIGYGHIYQGRYKSFPVQTDFYFLSLVRYVERNAKRAAFVKKAEDWKWSSIYLRLYGDEKQKKLLNNWPVEIPDNYLKWINQPQPKEEVENIRCNLKRNRPFGEEDWTKKMVERFGLETTMRNPWRPINGRLSP